MKATTKILHLRVDNNGTEPAVTPIYQCSAFTADSPYFYSDQEVMDIYVERARTVLSSKQAEQSAKMVLALDGAKGLAELMNMITFPEKT